MKVEYYVKGVISEYGFDECFLKNFVKFKSDNPKDELTDRYLFKMSDEDADEAPKAFPVGTKVLAEVEYYVDKYGNFEYAVLLGFKKA